MRGVSAWSGLTEAQLERILCAETVADARRNLISLSQDLEEAEEREAMY